MSNRVYKYIALAILIGAPIIVQILTSVLPAAPRAAEASNAAVTGETEVAEAAPRPAPRPMQQTAPSGAALVDSAPTLDTAGIAPTAIGGPEEAEAPAPPPPPAQPPAANKRVDDGNGPPPPRRPASMDR